MRAIRFSWSSISKNFHALKNLIHAGWRHKRRVRLEFQFYQWSPNVFRVLRTTFSVPYIHSKRRRAGPSDVQSVFDFWLFAFLLLSQLLGAWLIK